MTPAATVLALGPRRWAFLVRVAATAVGAEVAVRLLPLRIAARLAGAHLELEPTVAERDAWQDLPPRDRDRCDLALRLLGRRPLNATCLRRSLVLASVLRHRRPALRVGVAKSGGAVVAHAWLELAGATLDPDAVQFRPLAPVRSTAGGR